MRAKRKPVSAVPFDMNELAALIKRVADLVFDTNGTPAYVELDERERLIVLGALSAFEGFMVAQQVLYANTKHPEAPSTNAPAA
jgi:hypothetical protein